MQPQTRPDNVSPFWNNKERQPPSHPKADQRGSKNSPPPCRLKCARRVRPPGRMHTSRMPLRVAARNRSARKNADPCCCKESTIQVGTTQSISQSKIIPTEGNVHCPSVLNSVHSHQQTSNSLECTSAAACALRGPRAQNGAYA